RQYSKKYNLGVFGFFYNLFLLSLFLVVTAHNGIYFLFVWELMSLSSLFLVIFENQKTQIIKSGFIYFVMTHAATAFILLSFLLLYQTTGSFDFEVIKRNSGTIPYAIKTIILLCMIVGFGTKAGIIPFHIWLPRAHSAAPSQVSALMSGVMIKMGIFMMFKMFVDILPNSPLWLGYIILIIGAISSILGVLYALSEHDLKRLLAYHSIENIGIILLGLGSGIIFTALHQPSLAIIAISAGLFHTLNHAIFKSLLFLGAGSVISQTHTRNIEKYGGLIKLMPFTTLFFLVGAVAISGLPPFNGFVSEWLTFQSLFKGMLNQELAIKSVFIFAAGCLAFTGGLAAACFVKAFGITFLARSRSIESEKAKESSHLLTISMGFLAILCLIFGVFSSYFLDHIQMVVRSLGAFGKSISSFDASNFTLHVDQVSSIELNMLIVFIAMAGGIALAYGLTQALSSKQKTVIKTVWDCGYNVLTPRMEITATGFSRSLILIFKGIFQPSKQHYVEYVDSNIRYFSKSKTVTLSIINIYESYIYYPVHSFLKNISIHVRKIQSGNINLYLLYIFITLIGLLIFARI
ncbi:MAG: proton-conducting transporter membrane subunit, partial [Candidatus Levybacteria bacterium]|nr:proton-conducting transporter membrane subunit [Candidatus Levybacteria bacterium]